jgi:hypothetical protein
VKVKQTSEDLLRQLAEQIQFLRNFLASYDAGFEGESKRLAATIRLLVHDTKTCCSLLTQLGVKDSMEYYETAWDFNPRNLLTHNGLTGIRMTNGDAKFVALLDDRPFSGVWVTFTSWWNKIVFVDNTKNKFLRKDIILTVADQDGGAHVDPALDSTYAALTRENSLGWMIGDGRTQRPFPGPELPAVRQVAHEMLKALSKQFPNI